MKELTQHQKEGIITGVFNLWYVHHGGEAPEDVLGDKSEHLTLYAKLKI
jgi:hypothetical protein